MNKTVTINISGIIFHIEEDAYESLSKYLSTIKGYFSATDGGNEIMSDIEARIAELLQGKINTSKQVILMQDVEYVKDVMGKPEEFGETSGKEKYQSETEQTAPGAEKIKKRLFRNPDEKAIGGVCSGLAAYFDIDTVWVRLAMFLLIFFGGISLWVYIILWIIIPEAKTTTDKFAMRGESANINNIIRSFKEEAEDVKNRFNKYGNDLNRNYGESVRSNMSNALNTIFNVVGRLFGLFLLMIGGLFLFGYVAALTGVAIFDARADFTEWTSVIFSSPTYYGLALTSFILVCGIPIFMLLYTGIRLLFNIRYSNRWLNMSLGFIWLFGLILGVYVTVVTVRQFSEDARIKEVAVFDNTGDTLVVKLSPAAAVLDSLHFDNMDDLELNLSGKKRGYSFGHSGNSKSIIGYAELDVVESTGDEPELVISYLAKGATKKEANENARAIRYSFKQDKNTFIFDEVFHVDEFVKWRLPELKMKLMLPKGKVIYFDKSMKNFLNNVENTTNTWDGDMVERRWKMTDKGLTCIDCDNLHNIDEEWDHHRNKRHRTEKISIDERGVKVNGKDAEIKIDEHGILIKTEDGEEKKY